MNIFFPLANASGKDGNRHPRVWVRFAAYGFLYYYLSSLVVILGAMLGFDYFIYFNANDVRKDSLLTCLTNWDGQYYKTILLQGYSYDEGQQSTIAFFPVYPIVARLLMALSGIEPELALIVVAHLALLATFVMLAAYIHHRFSDLPSGFTSCVLLAFGFFPTTFFCRLAYTESLFILLLVFVLYGMERRWPVLLIAAIAALATATRPVGVAILPPLLVYLWHRTPSLITFLLKAFIYSLLACGGLIAFMVYQFMSFDEPLAFVKTQEHYRIRAQVPLMEKLKALAILEPVWSSVVPDSPCYWRHWEPHSNPVFSLRFANPLYFLLTSILIAVGWFRQWLSLYEVLLSVFLLMIPYLTRSHEMCMMSMGRFASVVLPMYLVIGHVLWRLPAGVAASLLVISGLFLATYTGFFVMGYPFY